MDRPARPGRFAIKPTDIGPKARPACARKGSAFAVAAQIDDGGEIERINSSKIIRRGIDMLTRSPQYAATQPPTARQRIAAIIAEVMYAGERENARYRRIGHADSG
jgi:hypothetical protein